MTFSRTIRRPYRDASTLLVLGAAALMFGAAPIASADPSDAGSSVTQTSSPSPCQSSTGAGGGSDECADISPGGPGYNGVDPRG